jgi:hypothetical protein
MVAQTVIDTLEVVSLILDALTIVVGAAALFWLSSLSPTGFMVIEIFLLTIALAAARQFCECLTSIPAPSSAKEVADGYATGELSD